MATLMADLFVSSGRIVREQFHQQRLAHLSGLPYSRHSRAVMRVARTLRGWMIRRFPLRQSCNRCLRIELKSLIFGDKCARLHAPCSTGVHCPHASARHAGAIATPAPAFVDQSARAWIVQLLHDEPDTPGSGHGCWWQRSKHRGLGGPPPYSPPTAHRADSTSADEPGDSVHRDQCWSPPALEPRFTRAASVTSPGPARAAMRHLTSARPGGNSPDTRASSAVRLWHPFQKTQCYSEM